MKRSEKYRKPSDLLHSFILTTPPEELEEIIASVDKLGITGPTFDEYLQILQEELGDIYVSAYSEEVMPVGLSSLARYQVDPLDWHYSPPSAYSTRNKRYQKDSVNHTESFFLLILCHGSTISSIQIR